MRKSVPRTGARKNESLVLYLVSSLGGRVARSRCAKLLYLTDYFARVALGRPVTSYEYALYEQGPSSPAIDLTVEQLIRTGKLRERFARDGGVHRYELVNGHAVPVQLSPEERYIADRVVEEYGRLPFDVLLDEIVFKTEPARRAREVGALGAPLSLSSCDGKLGAQHGSDFRTFVNSLQSLKSGKRIKLEEVIDSL